MKLKPALGVVLVFLAGVSGGIAWERCHRHQDDAWEVELRNARQAAANEMRLLEGELAYQKIRTANAIAAGERLKMELGAQVQVLSQAEVYERMAGRMDVAKRAFASLSEEGATGKIPGLEASEGYRVLDRVLRVGNP